MAATTRYPARTWEDLQSRLAGSFTARLRGLLTPEILLYSPEGEFGRVRSGSPDAKVSAGPLNAVIEQTGEARYRMLNGEATLVAEAAGGSADRLEIRAGERAYEASVSFLRNRAVVRSAAGEEVARLRGNLTGRAYQATFDPETAGALPIAVLLLYHTVVHRGRAFRTG